MKVLKTTAPADLMTANKASKKHLRGIRVMQENSTLQLGPILTRIILITMPQITKDTIAKTIIIVNAQELHKTTTEEVISITIDRVHIRIYRQFLRNIARKGIRNMVFQNSTIRTISHETTGIKINKAIDIKILTKNKSK